MKLSLTLDTTSSIALRCLAHELRCSEEEAAIRALRDALIGMGMFKEGQDLEEDSEVEGEA
ncbi:hypothetical protein [Mesorhizobium sp. J428]|uniref:hypothetical protein n=1 Tax=Mesorhizobium sp. J428 TaxID=2898440 RepID=UPI002150735C|nr:hypothetical protein [Mesorhizobium sp. J428]MCR5859754.1 hypothetical protein [Mesorhizobium sp. J428]